MPLASKLDRGLDATDAVGPPRAFRMIAASLVNWWSKRLCMWVCRRPRCRGRAKTLCAASVMASKVDMPLVRRPCSLPHAPTPCSRALPSMCSRWTRQLRVLRRESTNRARMDSSFLSALSYSLRMSTPAKRLLLNNLASIDFVL